MAFKVSIKATDAVVLQNLFLFAASIFNFTMSPIKKSNIAVIQVHIKIDRAETEHACQKFAAVRSLSSLSEIPKKGNT